MSKVSRLEGKVAFITGGARGQGRAHALALAREGADIVAVDILSQVESVPYEMARAADLEQTVADVQALGRRALGIQADVRLQEQLNSAVTRSLDAFGQIDILIANAGIWSHGQLWELTDEKWNDMIDVCLTGAWRTLKAVTPSMIERRQGTIVLIASVNGLEGAPFWAHYVAAKHGVIGLMRSAALELGPHGIRCNAVCPGFIDTQMTDWPGAYELTGGRPGATREEHEQGAYQWHLIAGKGLLPADSVSPAVLWLVTDENVTGLTVPVDAGHSVIPGFNPNPVRETS